MHVDLGVLEGRGKGALSESEHTLEQLFVQNSYRATGRDHSKL